MLEYEQAFPTFKPHLQQTDSDVDYWTPKSVRARY